MSAYHLINMKMSPTTETVSDKTNFADRVLSHVSTSYRKAHSPSLEGAEFDTLCPVLTSMTQTFSDLLIPVCEYPVLIQKVLPRNSSAINLTQQISKATDRLCEMNQHLVRLCQGSDEIPMEVELDALARDVLDDLIQQGKAAASLQIVLETDGQSTRLQGPQDALYHLVRDMCIRAFASMDEGGALTVRVGTVTIHTDGVPHRLGVPAQECLCLQFQDTSSEIHADSQTNRFAPFVLTSPGDEYGLRLSSVYRTMLQLNGIILYKSDESAGADYILFFPKATSP